jgi:hypothetical protein
MYLHQKRARNSVTQHTKEPIDDNNNDDINNSSINDNRNDKKMKSSEMMQETSVLTESHSREIHFSPMEIDTVFAADNSNQHHNKSNVRNDGKVFVETR